MPACTMCLHGYDLRELQNPKSSLRNVRTKALQERLLESGHVAVKESVHVAEKESDHVAVKII